MEEVLLKNKREVTEIIKLSDGQEQKRVYVKGKLLG